ncbi:hypothetical protein CLOM_g5558 [Closterium sp. NIES-68]|nr:hypothetical protein CLOM_g5558 [Closterium sp. NIES-68]GJP81835.1 hypothetical protein CLOP_g11953 [Closterium sp. NIES-67]
MSRPGLFPSTSGAAALAVLLLLVSGMQHTPSWLPTAQRGPPPLLLAAAAATGGQNYGDALALSILFFEQQRSGKLPPNQRAKWRGDSGLKDGKDVGVDLSKGYYDSGDNVKYGLPMAFTVATLAWGVVEYGSQLEAQGQLQYALDAVRWGADFFVNAHPEPNVLYAQVGDGVSDHACWQRPEDMTTPRTAYRLDAANPGTEVAAEAAAALAAASLAFVASDKGYSTTLLRHARELFAFADKYRRTYTASIPSAATYYQSYSGYNDELLWAAGWLYRATADQQYLGYIRANKEALKGAATTAKMFSWDDKYAGAQVLLSQLALVADDSTMQPYADRAQEFMCNVVGGTKTPGGLLIFLPWSNLQYVTSASLLLSVYSDYLDRASVASFKCASGPTLTPADLRRTAQKQVDYILGSNPKAMSYMAGYGSYYPKRQHHRGASLPSIKSSPAFIACGDGFSFFHTQSPNQNVLAGALVGGPDASDSFSDDRSNYQQNEPSTYVNAPLVGVLARIAGGTEKIPVTHADPAPITAPKGSRPGGSTGGGKGSGGGSSGGAKSPPKSPPKNTGGKPSNGKNNNGDSKSSSGSKGGSKGVRRLVVRTKQTGTWKDKSGQEVGRYSANITNVSGGRLNAVTLRASNFHASSYWGLTWSEKPRGYRIVQNGGNLDKGSSVAVVYIQSGGKARFRGIWKD